MRPKSILVVRIARLVLLAWLVSPFSAMASPEEELPGQNIAVVSDVAINESQNINTVAINEKPIAIAVHGYHPMADEFAAMDSALTAAGYTVLHFNYDWNERLDVSAALLARYVREVAQHNSNILVVGFSMGGLIARRSMVTEVEGSLADESFTIQLVTIAAPFAGFSSANMTQMLPYVMFGSHKSYRDLGSKSDFITRPGTLGKNVIHNIIMTDETQQFRCKHAPCDLHMASERVSDTSVLLEHQTNRSVLSDSQVAFIQVIKSGHVHSITQVADRILIERSPVVHRQEYAARVKR